MRMLHDRDTMTAEERLQAVTNLRVPDRVPSCPFIYYFAAGFAGITPHELWSQPKKYRMAMDKCWDELGPWDVYYPANPLYPELYTFTIPMKAYWPGRELPPDSICQFVESEIMHVEDYEWIHRLAKFAPAMTYNPFFLRLISQAWDHVGEGWRSYAFIMPRLTLQLASWRYEFETWQRRKGAAVLHGMVSEAAFDSFSLARGLMSFVRDLRERPDQIKQAADDLTEGYSFVSKLVSSLMGVRRVSIAVHRSSTDFISPANFRELSFPSLKDLVDKLVAAGRHVVLHCDGNWDLNLETLRELPAGNCLIQFDGPTDIFLAKQVIGDRICIMGDVPPDMFVLGSPSEVDEYCHRLIEEVGKGGGFVLQSGCEIPPNAKPENVKAMLDSVTKYGYYR